MLKAYSDYTKNMVIYVPPAGPQTGRYVVKIAAGGNQGNRTRNLQVLSKIYQVGVSIKEAGSGRPLKLNGPCNRMKRTVERNGTVRGTERKGPFLELFLDAYRILYVLFITPLLVL